MTQSSYRCKTHTVLSKIVAREFISFEQLSPKLSVLSEKLLQWNQLFAQATIQGNMLHNRTIMHF